MVKGEARHVLLLFLISRLLGDCEDYSCKTCVLLFEMLSSACLMDGYSGVRCLRLQQPNCNSRRPTQDDIDRSLDLHTGSELLGALQEATQEVL